MNMAHKAKVQKGIQAHRVIYSPYSPRFSISENTTPSKLSYNNGPEDILPRLAPIGGRVFEDIIDGDLYIVESVPKFMKPLAKCLN